MLAEARRELRAEHGDRLRRDDATSQPPLMPSASEGFSALTVSSVKTP